MADMAALRAGLAANLAPLGIQVSPYVLDNPTPPTVYVAAGPVEYDQTMGASRHDDFTFVVTGLVGYVSDIGAQMKLDEMLATGTDLSVKELLESDRTLGGAALSLHVPAVTGARVYTLAGPGASAPVIGAEWTVEVMATALGG